MLRRHVALGLLAVVICVAVIAFRAGRARSQHADPAAAPHEPSRLAVVWTSGDADVAHRVCFMYTYNAKRAKWFDEVQLIVWGPSARLLAGDKDLQAYVKKMQDAGVDVKACVSCANSYGVSEKLRGLGIEVKGMGKPLTDLLQDDGWKVITF